MNQISEKEINDVQKLKFFAEKAKNEIFKNNNLHKLIETYIHNTKQIKTILFDKENIEKSMISMNNNLKNDIEKIKNELQKIKNKYEIYYKKCTDELEMDRPILNQAKLDAFTLHYSLKEKDDIINRLKQNVNKSKTYSLFRETKRESNMPMKQRNILFKKLAEDLQLLLLIDSKKINKLIEKIKKNNQKKINLNNQIKKLNELIFNIKKGAKITKNNLNSNSQNKTMDETPSTNMELYTKGQKITELKNKTASKNNENFTLFENQKKYLEDRTINNDIQKKNSKKINKAILSARIPDSFVSLKTMSVNPAINDYIQQTEVIFENNNPDDNENVNINEIKCGTMKLTKALSAENRVNKKNKNQKKNKIIQSFINLEELFDITDSDNDKEEVLIDTVIHSDDETILEERIKLKKSLSKTYKEKLEKEIPKINLSLIEFNKLKAYQEVDVYSLQRRKYKGANIEDNIRITSKLIKKMKKKINLNSRKAKAMKKFIDDLRNKYKTYKGIRTKSSAINSKVKYISNNEIVDINNLINNDESDDDVGSDYLNEDDEEIAQKNN